MDGKDYLNSREGFLFMYEQGVRLFELDLSRTSDGVMGTGGITGTIPWDSGMATEKSPYRKGIQTK